MKLVLALLSFLAGYGAAVFSSRVTPVHDVRARLRGREPNVTGLTPFERRSLLAFRDSLPVETV